VLEGFVCCWLADYSFPTVLTPDAEKGWVPQLNFARAQWKREGTLVPPHLLWG